MKPYIHLSFDTAVPGGAGYIRYSREQAVRQDADDAFSVCVDLDANGEVVGIELTSLDDRAFDLVHHAAKRYDLDVPDGFRALVHA